MNLTRAEGYLELGMYQDAWEELENLPEELKVTPPVLNMRLHIFIGSEVWDKAALFAHSLLAAGDKDPSTIINGAYATRRAENVEAAKAFLLRGEAWMQREWQYHYNLACYDCVLGGVEAARRSLEKAFKLNPGCRQMALEEADLEAMWGRMAGEWPK